MGTYPSFSAIFAKGNNFHAFMFASLHDDAFIKEVYSKRKEFAPRGANSFFLELTSIEKGGKKGNG